jgi:Holliday junction resolvase RusA-like endonuclease
VSGDLAHLVPLPFELFIDCDPAPKGSVKVNAAGRGVRHTDRSKEFERDVADRLLREFAGTSFLPVEHAVLLTVEFRMRKLRGCTDPFPISLHDGDEDKLQRAFRDGLTKGRLIADDRLIVGGLSLQRWATDVERIGVMFRLDYAPTGYRLPGFNPQFTVLVEQSAPADSLGAFLATSAASNGGIHGRGR